jgi:preprotein translocase subunit SecA
MEEISQDILELARSKMREAGSYTREAFRDFIEESIEYYYEVGRLSEEDDLDALKEELMEMYNEVEGKEVEEREVGDEEEAERVEKNEELEEEKDEE